MAQNGKMGSALYAVAVKTPNGLEFQPPTRDDLDAIAAAEKELAKLRPEWERRNVIPTEKYPETTSDLRPILYGMPRWADLFSTRQLLGYGTFVEELKNIRPELVRNEGGDVGEAVIHLLSFIVSKMTNYNSALSLWHAQRSTVANTFNKHDFSFKFTFAEMAPCSSGAGLAWAISNTTEAFEAIAKLPHAHNHIVNLTQGSATNLAHLSDESLTAVIVDPPYADNVQYSELADFFYVWLKRTQGHRQPEWFSTHLCDHDEEAVVNVSRHRGKGEASKSAKAKAAK
jgi:adenine-specific DNA methylase